MAKTKKQKLTQGGRRKKTIFKKIKTRQTKKENN